MQTNVNFQLSSNVLENKQDLVVVFRPNSEVDPKAVFQFSIQLKERELFTKEMSFEANTEVKLRIDEEDFALLNGGVLTASLKNLQPWIAYEREEKGEEKKQTWEYTVEDYALLYQPMGEILFFKKPSETLQLTITTDEASYAPGDTVEYSVSVKEGGKTVSDGAYISVTATDESVFA